MRAVKVWQVTGRVRGEHEPPSRAMSRTVLFEAADFADAAEHAAEALLANWSSKPHVAVPLTLAPVTEKDGDQRRVYVRDGGADE